ncbi:uncharacterized protein LOC132177160 [Corylus avellana]|uniref:uncharacterized protein LOC132177160 n=1 Tax=Corylus avellana TaxID=13451 RepID=UPI00286BB79F|nr:uncharacterized protein LOC132177160 [Corylus avellana]
MEVGDGSRWHHLIFCEELQNNGEENHVLCIVCRKSVLGCPAYKCLECDFIQHKSCIEPTHAIEMQVDHDLQERHHMMFIEEVDDNSGNEKVVCSGCEEALFGPAYKCSVPKCTFLLHNSCTKLSHVIQHPMHLEHTLFLRLPSRGNRCDVCRQICNGSFYYRCYLCDFDIHIKCAPLWRINADDCHQHALLPTRKQIQFTCEACVEESKGIAYQCSLCGVFTHLKCARFPHTIKTRTHDHSLTRIYSLHQVKKEDIVFCKLCYRKIYTEYAAYSCWQCGYIAHLDCAYRLEDNSSTSTIEPVVSNYVGYESHLVHLVEGVNLKEGERAGPREIKHFSHPQHNLVLNNEKLMDDMRCENATSLFITNVLNYPQPLSEDYFTNIRSPSSHKNRPWVDCLSAMHVDVITMASGTYVASVVITN